MREERIGSENERLTVMRGMEVKQTIYTLGVVCSVYCTVP